jgi:hypothetical protein
MQMVSYRVHLACWPSDAHVVIENIMKICMMYPGTFGEVFVSRLPMTRSQPEIKIISFGEKLDLNNVRVLLELSNAVYFGVIAHVHEYDDERITDVAALGANVLPKYNLPKADDKIDNYIDLFRYITRRIVKYV